MTSNDWQHSAPGGAASAESPGLWLGLSIASTLLCCLPFGVVGIIYAALGMDAQSRGDIGLMEHRIRLARGWTIASVVASVVVIVLFLCIGAGLDNS